jgi:hypothetical protein
MPGPKGLGGPIDKSYPNTDFGGQGDLKDLDGTIEQCKINCSLTPDCNGFFHNGSHCWLKHINPTNKSTYNKGGTYYYNSLGGGNGPASLTCTSDDSGWAPKNVAVGEKTSKTCSGGGNETATCGSDGNWISFTGCPPASTSTNTPASTLASSSNTSVVSSSTDNTMLYVGIGCCFCCFIIIAIILIFILKKKH